MDGTPCDGPNLRGHNAGISMERTERWLCVAGQCKSVGCDGVIGSGATMDACGVCGGRGQGCRLFEGIFMEPILPKGHHSITTIPKGAMSLNISELRFSTNFLEKVKTEDKWGWKKKERVICALCQDDTSAERIVTKWFAKFKSENFFKTEI
ncbi:hypothetical protein HZH68_014442 [Vespula germanica]|uniref:ADAMTS/ADAMTS-like cysteine-rich domain-containing protein n=1 Tax=Vespula germanica TaxID=30212 RepID=A0A834MUE3_VESGE|nr:hypothetical protein HZH68_014442 [Vespula germanica]